MNIDDPVLKKALQKARSRRATDMTPEEMAAFRKFSQAKAANLAKSANERKAKALAQFPDHELAVHAFMLKRYEELRECGDVDLQDAVVAVDAAMKFGITEDEANRIFISVDAAGILEE